MCHIFIQHVVIISIHHFQCPPPPREPPVHLRLSFILFHYFSLIIHRVQLRLCIGTWVCGHHLDLSHLPVSHPESRVILPSSAASIICNSCFMLGFWLVWFCVGKHGAVIWCVIDMLYQVSKSLYVLALFHLYTMKMPELSVGRLIYDAPTTECFELFILGTQTRYEFLH